MDNIPLEFTTTATCRTSIIKRTYDSFKKNLMGVDWEKSTLYVNIDPIGGEGSPEDILAICRNSFGNVVYNLPKTCNFCAGHKWTWEQPKEKYFFTLQEDWVLKIPVRIRSLSGKLTLNGDFKDRRNKTVIVSLRAYATIKDNRVCLSPGMVLTEWAKFIANRMDITKNPEKQCRPWSPGNPVGKNRVNYTGLQHPPLTRAVLVVDIGRHWMTKNGLHRPGGQGAYTFTNWKTNKAKIKYKPTTPKEIKEKASIKKRLKNEAANKEKIKSNNRLKIKHKKRK